MTNEFAFRTPSEEIDHLASELAEVRVLLRDISQRLSLIERHAKRLVPASLPKKAFTRRARGPKSAAPVATISTLEARTLFDTLSESLRRGDAIEVDKRLRTLSIPDLAVIAKELGVPSLNRPTRRNLYAGIAGRLKESAMLSGRFPQSSPRQPIVDRDRAIAEDLTGSAPVESSQEPLDDKTTL
jgi:hypothetical protein